MKLLSLLLALLSGFGCSVAHRDGPPATVEFLEVRGGKPPMRGYTLRLDVVNRHDQPMWFIMRYWGDKPLPGTDRLVERPGDIFMFIPHVLSVRERSNVYEWEKQPSFGVSSLGGDQNFIAIRLPSRKALRISDAGIDAWSPIHEFEVCEASEILINDSTPLQQWIASRIPAPDGHYATLTDRNRDPMMGKEIQRAAPREDADEIKSMTLMKTRRWTLPIAGIEKAPVDPWTH